MPAAIRAADSTPPAAEPPRRPLRYTLRPARADDAQPLSDVHERAILALPGAHPTPQQRAAWAARMRPERFVERTPARRRVVAELADANEPRLIGYAQLHVDEGTLEAVYVDPDFTRRGVGRALVAALEREARAHRLPGLVVEATENSVAFYRALGFVAKAVDHHPLAPGIDLVCTVMEKRLAPDGTGAPSADEARACPDVDASVSARRP